MTTDPLDRFERLFQAALMHPPDERAAFLDAACGDDPSLREELESLLAADDEADAESFLDAPAGATMGSSDTAAPQGLGHREVDRNMTSGDSADRRRIGPFTVLRKLGRGGMGDVYLAMRERPFKQYVALKVIRRGMDTEEVLQRFEMERQILASLSHPNIAQLLDGGVTEDGLPFFVMEYVEGLPITTYCNQRRLPVRERLRLFLTVCEAVQYAHQNLIIHRDLKPNNILVTSSGTVKLLDFGVAKLLNPSLSPITMPVTRTELRMMTPEYASPEQVRGEPLTTASDVYALGVILYELLSGYRPYRIVNRAMPEIVRIVEETEPERPSTRVARTTTASRDAGDTDTQTADSIGTARATTIDRLQRTLRGDLDNIVLMALRKEPHRRFRTAEQLGQDVENHLRGMPVAARPSTLGYRVTKFVRRHRIIVVATSMVMLALVSGLGVALWQAGLARTERDRAQTEAQKAAQVTGFVLSLFETADPATAPGDTLLIRDVLEAGAARVESELAGQPAVQADLLGVIGQAYQNLGRFDLAERHLEQALALLRSAYGERSEQVAATLLRLAELSETQHELDAADQRYRSYVSLQRTLHGEAHPAVLLGTYRLWGVQHMNGQPSDSLFEVVQALQRRLPAMDDPVQSQAIGEIGAALYHMRRFDESEDLLRRALEMDRRLMGERHPRVARLMSQLAAVLNAQDRYGEAETMARRAVGLHRAIHPNGHADVIQSTQRLADAYVGLGRPDDAERLFRDALALVRENEAAGPALEVQYLMPLARLLVGQGRFTDAEAVYREVVTLHAERHGSRDVRTVEARERLADVLRSQERYPEAETLLLDSYRILRARAGDGNLYTRAALRRLVALYDAWDRPEDAARYQALLDGP